MATELKENTGVFFANGSRKSDKSPNFTGSANIGGVKYRVAIWRNESKEGNVYHSMTFELKEDNKSQPAAQPQTQAQSDNMVDDDIPWN